MSNSSVDWLAIKSPEYATQQQFMRHRFLRSIQAQTPILAIVSIAAALLGLSLAFHVSAGLWPAQAMVYLIFMLVSTGVMLETWRSSRILNLLSVVALTLLLCEVYAFVSTSADVWGMPLFGAALKSPSGQTAAELFMALLVMLAFIFYRYRRAMWSQCLLSIAIFMPATDLLASLYQIPDAYGQLSLLASLSGLFSAMALLATQMSQTPISYLFLMDDSGSHLRWRVLIMSLCAVVLGGIGVLFKHDPRLTPVLITVSLLVIVCTLTITYYRKGVVHEQVLPPGDLAFASELESAIAHQQFYLVFQPQINFQSGETVGVEALIRWQHPQLGVVSPVKFIGVAELTGLIVPMGAWVLRAACMQAASWTDPELVELKISVNVSPLQLRSPGFVAFVSKVLQETGLSAERLVIELTESAFVHNDSHGAETMLKLKQMGIKLAIDDFGTGYSCLAYLRDIPGDYLKVDRSFVRELPGQDRSEAVTRAIVALGKSLHYQIVAEGVETEAQADFLKALGCDLVQGFLYAKPMPAEDLHAWVIGREGRRTY